MLTLDFVHQDVGAKRRHLDVQSRANSKKKKPAGHAACGLFLFVFRAIQPAA
jgi:hypothetical protein